MIYGWDNTELSLWKLFAVTLAWGLRGQTSPSVVTRALPGSLARDTLRMLMELAFSPPAVPGMLWGRSCVAESRNGVKCVE